jgi:hypothetical protein
MGVDLGFPAIIIELQTRWVNYFFSKLAALCKLLNVLAIINLYIKTTRLADQVVLFCVGQGVVAAYKPWWWIVSAGRPWP